ncbi:GNAT family N-acetyltransferase [Lacticaseibacillus brantae]|uniref:GNAT family acetyltraansferase n=1 Tax=Lacticaseibacillus brantae DSM 23927 TaxID=1423727 RepID=A0A0R2AZ30_9LACO|nr:GNAT family N-acetyltransferase [Lacticaseibacillus brantae]KRM72021.1 GNAT family acetyltraansferase [Lacticaseibacillus brantae DSM 23927]
MVAPYQFTSKDERPFYDLVQYAFNKPQTPTRDATFASLFAHSLGWGSGQPLHSGFLATKFTVDLAGTAYQMAGVGYVASYPEASGQGEITALMHQAFSDMRMAGMTLAYLAPFSSQFYRRFGFEHAFGQATHTLPAAALPQFDAPHDVLVTREPLLESITAISPVYLRNSAVTHGAVRREQWWWENLVTHYPSRELAVARMGDHVTGYMIYERLESHFVIHELFFDDLPSLQALGHFVDGHQNMFADVTYVTGNVRPLYDLVPESTALTTTVKPYMMARIVDVADFLARYPYQVSDLAPVLLQINDDFISENDGLWQLQIDDGQVTFQKVVSGEPSVTLDIRELVKAAFGVRSLRSAYALGQIDGDPFTVATVSELFTQKPSQLYDYF